jgi:ABC-type bacteriocin/lantibiotic exporter with double-glycine peptidase domain
LIVLFITVQLLITSIFPYLTKIIIDNIINLKSFSNFNNLIFITLILILVQIPTNISLSYFSAKWTQEIVFDLRSAIGLEFINTKENSDTNGLFINSILSDCDTIGVQLLSLLINGAPNILLVIICICILLILNIKLTFIICIMIPFFLMVSAIASKVMYKCSKKIQETKDVLVQFLNTHVKNKLLIDLYNMRLKEYESYRKNTESIKKLNIYASTILSFFNNISGLITTVTPILCLFVGGRMVLKDEISLGDLVAFNSYISLIFSPLSKILNLPSIYAQMKVSMNRIEQLYFEDNVNTRGVYIKDSSNNDGYLTVNGLIPYINNSPLNIQALSVHLEKGELLRLTGKNGIGKSLVLKCLVGYHSSFDGEIVVSQSSKISYIPQENYLFEGTVYENLTKGLQNISKNELVYYCTMLNFDVDWSFYCSPFKMNLSSGQMQKIKLIRALLEHPQFLLLDETLSNLDKSSIKNLVDFIQEKEISSIFIHHGSVSDFLSETDYSVVGLS